MCDNTIDLDYDDELELDAQQFGLDAQGAAKVADGQITTVPPKAQAAQLSNLSLLLPEPLYQALVIAREVYGETNSEHSEVFCDWIGDVIAASSSIRETKEMLNVLHSDKENFGGHLAWTKDKEDEKKRAVRARRHASICAMNITRAVLNRLKGLEYKQWLERAMWRAVQAENDMKGTVL